MEITLVDLWNVLKKAVFLMLICAVIFALIAGVYTAKFVQKVYTSSTSYVLLVKNDSTTSDKGSIENLNNALVVGAKAIPTVLDYVITETMMESVLRYIEDMHSIDPENPLYHLDHSYTPTVLKNAFAFQLPAEETGLVFKISCRAYSSQDSCVLLQAFGAVVNERAEKPLLGTYYIEPCDPPKAGALTSPNLSRNIVLAGLAGAILPYIAVLVITILDARIKKEEDLKNNFDYPLLGQIPHF